MRQKTSHQARSRLFLGGHVKTEKGLSKRRSLRNGRRGFIESRNRGMGPLENPNSFNKESRLFFLSDSSIWSFPSVSSLSDYSMWRS